MNIRTDIREYEYEYEYSSHTVGKPCLCSSGVCGVGLPGTAMACSTGAVCCSSAALMGSGVSAWRLITALKSSVIIIMVLTLINQKEKVAIRVLSHIEF